MVRPHGIRKVLIDELEFLKWLKANPNQNSDSESKPLKLELKNKPKLENRGIIAPTLQNQEELRST